MDFKPSEMVAELVREPREASTLKGVRASALSLSTLLKAMPARDADRKLLSTVEASLFEAFGRELSAMYIEIDPIRAANHLIAAGVITNLRRAARATSALLDQDAESLRKDEVYLSEAADILSKSIRAFSEADGVSARDAAESFKLFVPSLGSKQRMATQSALLWCMTVAINSYFTARLLI